MQELWPQPTEEFDVVARIGGDDRPAPADRPWVAMVMIASLDGAITIDGLSGGLGGPADYRRLVAVRQSVQAIVVGATTVTDEDYAPSSTPLAVVTGSLSLDPSARVFSDPDKRPLLYTTSQAAQTHGPRFYGIAEVVNLGDSLDPVGVLRDLRRRGFATVGLEGGATLNGHMLAADVVDEILLTLSPKAVLGPSPRLAHALHHELDLAFELDRVALGGGFVFLRYLRNRTID